MERNKIAFLDEGRGIGGAEKNLITFLKYLDKDRFKPLVILSTKGKLFTALNNIGIKTVVINFISAFPTSIEFGRVRILNPFAIMYEAITILINTLKLHSYLSRNKISILQTNGASEHIYGGIAAKLSNTYCIWYMQDIPKGSFRRFKRLIVNILAFILPEKIIAVSYAVEKVFYKKLKKKINVIHVGIDLSEYKTKPSQEITKIKNRWNLNDTCCIIAMAGRLVYWKGHISFIKAAKIISKSFPTAKFLIVGDVIFGKERYRRKLNKIIRQLQLEEKVIFTGFIEDTTEFLSIIDIFIQCSLYPDPCPIAVLEAGIFKKAIIATDVGGIPEIIESGKEGILIAPNNPQALALEIINLMNSPKLRQLLGEQAYNKIKNKFDIRHETQRFEEIYSLC